MGKKGLAVILPGIGYHKDKPLLYYTAKLMRSKDYDIICIEYSGMPEKIKGDAGMMKKAAEIACEQTANQLDGVDFSEYDDVVFIAKSIGTVASARFVDDKKLSVRQVWYTPVTATFSIPAKDVIAFIGDADPWSDVEKLKGIAAEKGITMYSYPDCNHSLECGDAQKDIDTLADVMKKTKKYLKRG